jgi:hypothetical protein
MVTVVRPQRAPAARPEQVTGPGDARTATEEALAQRKGHGRKRAGQARPLHRTQPLGLHEQRQQGRHPERRGVEKHGQAGSGGVLQPQVDAGELPGEQRAGQQARPQRAVAREQRHAAHAAPDPQQQRGPGKTHRRLEHRWHFGQRGFHQHLLETPEQAAGQQQRDGGGVEVVFANGHGVHGTGRAPGKAVREATAAPSAVAGHDHQKLIY